MSRFTVDNPENWPKAKVALPRSYDRENRLGLLLIGLYVIYACELASLILLAGGGWGALVSPVVAACGPRYWKSLSHQVAFYVFWVTCWGALVISFAVHKLDSPPARHPHPAEHLQHSPRQRPLSGQLPASLPR